MDIKKVNKIEDSNRVDFLLDKNSSLVFSELMKRKYKVLDGKRIWDLADSKLWYLLPDQAQGFLDLENADEYKKSVTDLEISLLRQNVNVLAGYLTEKNYNLIDLGCGDGGKATILLKKLVDKKSMRYCPIDISAHMVDKASEKVESLGLSEVVDFKWNVSDFDNLSNIVPLLRRGKYKNNIVLLLGNTLGNFDCQSFLYDIRQNMKKGDVFVVGNGLNSVAKERVIEQYRDSLLDDFLFGVVKQLGLKKEDVKYDVRFNNSRVEMYYKVLHDIELRHLEKEVSIKYGDEINVGVSYKFSLGHFENLLRVFFSEVYVVDSDSKYALGICVV